MIIAIIFRAIHVVSRLRVSSSSASYKAFLPKWNLKGLAPPNNNLYTIAVSPNMAAFCSGVSESFFIIFGFAPYFMHRVTISGTPSAIAIDNDYYRLAPAFITYLIIPK